MKVEAKTKAELERELGKIRQRLAELEASETERRRAEEPLQAEHADILFNSSLDMIISVDLNRNITEFNRAAEEAFGYAKEELLGRPVNLLYADQAEGLRTHINIVKDGQFKGEIRNRRKNGDTFYSYLSSAVMRDADGRVVGLMGISRDITELKRAEVALRESETRFRSLVESANAAIILADTGGAIISWNKGAETIFGYAQEEVLGKPLTFVMPERYKDAYRRGLEHFRSTGESRVIGKTVELQGLTRDGSEFPLELSLSSWKAEGRTFYSGIIHDITERKRAETEIRQAKEKYEHLIENIPDTIYSSLPDETGTTTFISERWKDWTGYSPADFYKGHATWPKCIHPEDRDKTMQAFINAYEEKREYALEYRVVHKVTGEVRHLRDCGLPIRNEKGEIIRFDGVVSDITERKRAEVEARKARQYLTRLIESSTDAIISTDNEGNVVLFNKGAEAILGYAREDILGQRVTVVYETEERAKEVMRQMRQGGGTVAGFETILRAKGGSLIPVLISASILFDAEGQETGTVGFNKDLRERKRGEEALKKSQERFDLAVSGTTDGIWDWDILTDKEWWSPRFHELLGYAEGEIEATYAMFLELLHPKDKYTMLEAVRAHLEDRVRYDVEIRLRTKSGEYRWFRSRGQALWDKTGKPVRMAGSIQDITDRKRAEEALRASSLRLVEAQETERHHIARELHDEIGQALTGLKLNLETKTRLPAGVGGEGLVEATAVVNDIMGKVRELSLSLRPPMLDDFGLMHALLWHFQRYTANTNVQVTTSNLNGLTGLDGRRFPSEIETAAYRIVQEALTNIARHAHVPEATVGLWTDHTTLYVQVQDHGIGFDPGSVQASRPCSGLSGMRERVALLNGYFTLESAPGAGTQMTAELPLGVSVEGGTERGQDDNTVGR